MESATIFPSSEQLALPEPERREDTPEQKALAQLPAGHPLLARAQEALKQQLSATKLRLEEELREKQNTLKVWCLLHGKTQACTSIQISSVETLQPSCPKWLHVVLLHMIK